MPCRSQADLLTIGKAKQSETLGGYKHEAGASVLSQNDTTEKHSTRKSVAKSAGVSTGQIGMAERIRAA